MLTVRRTTHRLPEATLTERCNFAALVRSPTLGRAVAEVMGWRGARVANDQAWGKPPGAAEEAGSEEAGRQAPGVAAARPAASKADREPQ